MNKIYRLPNHFEKKSKRLTFDKCFENDDFYMYKVVRHGDQFCDTYSWCELFRRKESKPRGHRADCEKYKGYDLYEQYPNDSDFGKWAWAGNGDLLISNYVGGTNVHPC